jgi:multimeric flavodoxin WrbA
MNILVLNGSPKGENSITLQTVRFWEILYPEHNFTVLHVGQKIRSYERDFTEAATAVAKAEILLFSYPVYTFIAPCQLHRFIELMKEHKVDVTGKIATQLSTSKHFYDITAHRYIQDNCQEMGMNYIRGLSADMEDLPTKKGQEEAKKFFEHLVWCVEQKQFEPCYLKTTEPKRVAVTIPSEKETATKRKGDVVIITDATPENAQLNAMISRFRSKLPVSSRIVNIREYPLKGGCLGCFHCAADGTCIYNDGFDSFLRDNIQKADAIIYAFTISDHSMGSRFKMYDDRQFCNGHRTVTMGMPMGYLISGNYSEEQNLQMILEGRAQVGGNILAGIATDEVAPDIAIDQLASSLEYALEHKNTQPQNFYGVGGMKIFRDLIYQMQGLMRADYKFFKSHGQFDFPQKKKGTVLAMYLVGAMMNNKKIKAKMGNKMTEGMLMPYKKVLDELKK